MATSSKITDHVTKLKSSQTGFLNIIGLMYSDGLHSHHIPLWEVVEQKTGIMDGETG